MGMSSRLNACGLTRSKNKQETIGIAGFCRTYFRLETLLKGFEVYVKYAIPGCFALTKIMISHHIMSCQAPGAHFPIALFLYPSNPGRIQESQRLLYPSEGRFFSFPS